MGFAHLPQWIRHDVEHYVCTRCQSQFAENGVICTKDQLDATKQRMVFVGVHPNATLCQRRAA